MPKAVLDSTILISALLAPEGISDQLLRQGRRGAFVLCLSEAILEETQRVLLEEERIRRRYPYTNDDVKEFISELRRAASMVSDIPLLQGISRDPNDDMVIACAVAAQATYLVTRDKDLLTLTHYQKIRMTTPEQFIEILRK
jgi:uncharacterized protein